VLGIHQQQSNNDTNNTSICWGPQRGIISHYSGDYRTVPTSDSQTRHIAISDGRWKHFYLVSNLEILSSNDQIKYYYIVRPKVNLRAGQLCLPHIGILKQKEIELKHKNRWASKSSKWSRAVRSVIYLTILRHANATNISQLPVTLRNSSEAQRTLKTLVPFFLSFQIIIRTGSITRLLCRWPIQTESTQHLYETAGALQQCTT